MHRPRATLLLLAPLLAAGCATAAPPAAAPEAAAREVRIAEVRPRTILLEVRQPVHVALLEVWSGPLAGARWMGERGSRVLPAATQRLALGGRAPYNGLVRGVAAPPGAPCVVSTDGRNADLGITRAAADPAQVRGSSRRGRRMACPRGDAPASETSTPALVMVVSREPVEAVLLDDVMAVFNDELTRPANTAARDLAGLLAMRIQEVATGVHGYPSGIPNY
jgi:hypothetical protein